MTEDDSSNRKRGGPEKNELGTCTCLTIQSVPVCASLDSGCDNPSSLVHRSSLRLSGIGFRLSGETSPTFWPAGVFY